jgi:hypothetical protein
MEMGKMKRMTFKEWEEVMKSEDGEFYKVPFEERLKGYKSSINNRMVTVRIGIENRINYEIFEKDFNVVKGVSEEEYKKLACEWFEKNKPTREEIKNIENLIADKKAFVKLIWGESI